MEIDIQIVGKWTTLYYVIRTGSSHVVEMLLSFGASPNKCDNSNDWSPMHVAAQEHNIKIVDILYKYGSIIHCLTVNKQSPFALALSPSSYEKKERYQTAKKIKMYEIDSLARAMILTLALGQMVPQIENVVALSVKKHNEKMNNLRC